MPLTAPLDVPKELGYVFAVIAATGFTNTWIALLVSKKRKKAGIAYPNTYATDEQALASPDAYAFNCAQRAHSNFLEHLPTAIASLFISGLKYPITASLLGVGLLVGRIVYTLGYVRDKPGNKGKGRLSGSWHSVFLISLLSLSAWTAVGVVLQ